MLFGKRKRIVNRILIVEDEPLTAFDNENLIGDEGYEVVATLDRFRDAIKILDQERVDLILCDVRLTGERSGVDLAREAQTRGIPVLFVTGAPPIVNCTSGCTSRIGCSALTPPRVPPVSFGSTKCTNSWRMNDMPIAVMRKTRAGAPRRRSGL